MRVYPNPSVERVELQLNNGYLGAVYVSVIDANLGITRHQITWQKNTRSFSGSIDLTTLPYGIYLLDVKQGNERTIRRIMKVR